MCHLCRKEKKKKKKGIPGWKPKLCLLPVQFYPWLAAGEHDATWRSGTWIWSGTRATSKCSALHAASAWGKIGALCCRPGPADVWGWVCKSFAPERSTKGRWRPPTPFCSQNVWVCTRWRAQGIPPVAAGTARLGRFLLRFCTSNWIWGFGKAGFVLLLVSLESRLITLLEAVSTFSKNQQAASTGRVRSELTTRKT